MLRVAMGCLLFSSIMEEGERSDQVGAIPLSISPQVGPLAARLLPDGAGPRCVPTPIRTGSGGAPAVARAEPRPGLLDLVVQAMGESFDVILCIILAALFTTAIPTHVPRGSARRSRSPPSACPAERARPSPSAGWATG